MAALSLESMEKIIVNRHSLLVGGCALLCLSGSLLSFSAAAADTGGGWYAGGKIGFDLPTSESFNSSGDGFTNKYDTGFVGGFNGGYSFGNGLRPEIEFDYHHANIDTVTVASTSTGTTDPAGRRTGSIAAMTLMGNLWYDFRRSDGFLSILYPYVGLGLGVANVSLHNEQFNTFTDIAGGADGSSTAFAYQLGFGMNYDMLSYLSASLDFRYLATTSLSLSGASGSVSGEYRMPSILLGLKYRFGGGD